MKDFSTKDADSHPLSVDLLVVATCQRFETACKGGETPRIEEYLGEATGAQRMTLLKELIVVDLFHRRQRGEAVVSAKYLARFPELDSAWLDSVIPRTQPVHAVPSPPDGETVPEVGPSRAAQATGAPSPRIPGYEVLGELGRGGMGAVYKGRDPELGRELAIKVLLERHHDNPRTVERFLEEAQVGGQLQHPGVVPVYEAGRLPDNRPYFTMKLVEGRTLATLLKERDTPARDLPRFLQIFTQVCQTLAYAHSKGVIHRDLKPANAMVGAFGELQVMDWGLAKVVQGRGVKTIRSETAEGKSEAGSVIGTPAYMAPEQACGDVEGLDQRCDVFGLGAILCEILTGAPPYRGRDRGELLRKAARADTTDALTRLDASGAGAELANLAKACLAAEQADRPRDAGSVATAMTAYLAGVQERLRQAELDRATAQARAEEAQATTRAERRARRMTVALAATLLLAVSGAGIGALCYQQDRAVRAAEDARLAKERARIAANTERDVTASLEDALALRKAAAELHHDPAKWDAALEEALSAIKRASAVLNSGVDDTGELGRRVDALRAELEAADRDPRMVARLEAARFQVAAGGREGGFDKAGAVALYGAAFRQDDKDWDSLGPNEAAARISRRAIREDLLAALDEWAYSTPNQDEATRLRGIVQAADPDAQSLRNRFRALLDQKNWTGLYQLAFSPEAKDLPTARLERVGWQLNQMGAASEAVKFLKEANDRHPGDFWIAFDLACAYGATKPPATDEAIRYYTAALMLRDNSAAAHNNLGEELHHKGQLNDAIAECRKALKIQPNFAEAYLSLANALYDNDQLDDAIAAFRDALQIQPDDSDAFYNAACEAALAGCGQGRYADKLEAKMRTHLREQALQWFRADLDLCGKNLNTGIQKDRTAVISHLQDCQEDSDLTGLRDANALAKLPTDEREGWRKLWADQAALLKKAREK